MHSSNIVNNSVLLSVKYNTESRKYAKKSFNALVLIKVKAKVVCRSSSNSNGIFSYKYFRKAAVPPTVVKDVSEDFSTDKINTTKYKKVNFKQCTKTHLSRAVV